MKGGYKFGGNAYEIFEKFFGTINPHVLLKDSDKSDDQFPSMLGTAFGGLYYSDIDPPKDLEICAECTLEEINKGGLKNIKYEKIVIKEDGRTTSIREVERSIDLIKGVENGHKFTYIGEGNQKPSYTNCKYILFIVKQI